MNQTRFCGLTVDFIELSDKNVMVWGAMARKFEAFIEQQLRTTLTFSVVQYIQ